jgi:hypothetical protein
LILFHSMHILHPILLTLHTSHPPATRHTTPRPTQSLWLLECMKSTEGAPLPSISCWSYIIRVPHTALPYHAIPYHTTPNILQYSVILTTLRRNPDTVHNKVSQMSSMLCFSLYRINLSSLVCTDSTFTMTHTSSVCCTSVYSSIPVLI